MRLPSTWQLSLFVSACLSAELVGAAELEARFDAKTSTVTILRENGPTLTQHARADHRPFLHPIVAPDGKGVLT
ncbi:MAG: hypothetical protein H8E37_12125, partial [Planctomycetes bacterium]|nr:hypothetical protein [Planctomycetota bacterium]